MGVVTAGRGLCDELAERCVAGCAIASRHGAALAAERVRAADFYNVTHGRLLAAALCLDDIEHQAVRVSAVSVIADVRLVELEALVDDRPVQWDTNGTYATRVVEAARRRALMVAASEVLDGLSQGSALADLHERLVALAGAVA